MQLCEKHDECYVIFDGPRGGHCPICDQIANAEAGIEEAELRAEEAESKVGELKSTVTTLEERIEGLEDQITDYSREE
jgi:peptidoglycan hydrolase CwlO-like protein